MAERRWTRVDRMIALYSKVPFHKLTPRERDILNRVAGTQGVDYDVAYPRVNLIPTDEELDCLDEALKNLGFHAGQ